jgi:CheY-like chemotaxis protein
MSERREGPVVVVEDSDDDWDTILTVAREAGVDKRLQRAVSGEAGLERLRASERDGLAPAFVLLDLNLPGIDGRDVLVAIKADPDLRCLPVIVVTTSFNPRDIASCYAAGANAYHVKPLRYTEHTRMLRSVFEYWSRYVALPAGVFAASA